MPRRALWIFCLLLCSRAAYAQDLPADPLAVEPESEPDAFWGPTVVTPTGQPTRASDSPSTTYVITGDEVRRSGSESIPEILRRVAGLDVRSMTAADGQVGPRGFAYELSDRVLVLVDGRTVYIDFFGGTVYEVLPIGLLDIDRIEVVIGPGASIYGNKAMAGTINIITRSALDFPYLEARASIGASGDARGALRWATLAGPWQLRLSTHWRNLDDDALDPLPAARLLSANVTAGYSPTPAMQLSAEAGLTYGLALANASSFSVDAFMATLAYARLDGRWALGGVNAPWGTLQLRAWWNGGALTSSTFPYPTGGFNAHYHTPVAEVSHHLSYSGFGLPMQVRWGAEARVNWLRSSITQDEATLFNIAGFASNELLLDRWRLALGLRVDHQDRETIASPRLSVVYLPAPDQQLRLAFNESYNNPPLMPLFANFSLGGLRVEGQPNLNAERMDYVELGYAGRLLPQLRLFANAFFYRLNRYIALTRVAPETGQFRNNPPLFGSGGELGASLYRGSDMSLTASYAFLRLVPGAGFPYHGFNVGSPLHKVSLNGRLALLGGFFASADAQVISAVQIDRIPSHASNAGVFEIYSMNPFVLVHARLGWALENGLELSLAATNLFNDNTLQFPGAERPRRRVFLTLSYAH